MLKGKKTYLVACLWGGAVALSHMGVINPMQLEAVQSFLVPIGLATLRAGVGK